MSGSAAVAEAPPGDSGLAAVPEEPTVPVPDDGVDEEEQGQLFLAGNRELGAKVQGRKPDSSVLKVKGGKIEVQGQFDRGDRFIVVQTLQVTGDNDQDTIEKLSGDVKSTSKSQAATICGVTRIEEYLAERIEDRALLDQVLDALGIDGGGQH